MRRVFVVTLAAPLTAFAATLAIPSEAAGQLLDPGWQIVYVTPSNSGSGSGLLGEMFGDGEGPVVVAPPYRPGPAYYRPAPPIRAYQAAPTYYAQPPMRPARDYQPAPTYYVPAQQTRAYQGVPPVYGAPGPLPQVAVEPAPQSPPQRSFFQLIPPPQANVVQAPPQYAPPQQVAFAAPPPPYAPAVDPKYDRQIVAYSGDEKPGTVIIDTPHFFLYLVLEGGKAIRYGIGVGRPGFTWAGVKEITSMREWPDWIPPSDMLRRRPDLPRYMAGGPDNPLGARALYLGSTLYRIHGSNEPWTIGAQVSSGCIRLRNADVIDLYSRVQIGTKVVVL